MERHGLRKTERKVLMGYQTLRLYEMLEISPLPLKESPSCAFPLISTSEKPLHGRRISSTESEATVCPSEINYVWSNQDLWYFNSAIRTGEGYFQTMSWSRDNAWLVTRFFLARDQITKRTWLLMYTELTQVLFTNFSKRRWWTAVSPLVVRGMLCHGLHVTVLTTAECSTNLIHG